MFFFLDLIYEGLISHLLIEMKWFDPFSSQLTVLIRCPEESGTLFEMEVKWVIWNCGSLWEGAGQRVLWCGVKSLETWEEGFWLDGRRSLLEERRQIPDIPSISKCYLGLTQGAWNEGRNLFLFLFLFPFLFLLLPPALCLTCCSQTSHLHHNPTRFLSVLVRGSASGHCNLHLLWFKERIYSQTFYVVFFYKQICRYLPKIAIYTRQLLMSMHFTSFFMLTCPQGEEQVGQFKLLSCTSNMHPFAK